MNWSLNFLFSFLIRSRDRYRRSRSRDRYRRSRSRDKRRSRSRERKKSISPERRKLQDIKRYSPPFAMGPSPGPQRRPRSPDPEPPSEERDRRTVMCMQLSARVGRQELLDFFQDVGGVCSNISCNYSTCIQVFDLIFQLMLHVRLLLSFIIRVYMVLCYNIYCDRNPTLYTTIHSTTCTLISLHEA